MSDSSYPPVIAIFGPTGVGKTACAVDLALALSGEVVNADSRYLYRHLNIGVAKPTHEERRGVRHHLIDIFEPHEFITVAQVQHLAYAAIDEITERAKIAILTGGTPLYMNAIVEGWRIPEVAPDWSFREQIAARIEQEGLGGVAADLKNVDPVAFERSAQNARRVIRALEVHHVTGIPMSTLEGNEPPPYRFLKIALTRNRADHYLQLDSRIDEQIRAGLLDEVRGLLEAGLRGDEPAFSAIGYRQLMPVVSGEQSLADAIAQIKHDTHRYVRHQMTWLRRTPDLHWFDTGIGGWQSRVMERARDHVLSTGPSES
jgi:tRNA dimethylallyltransferase